MPSSNQPNFYYDPMNPAQYLQYSPGSQQQFNREHNKSVQVESEEEEEEEELIRRTGKKAIGKKTTAKRWFDEEEVALARS
ncbi:hypothetical protein E3N88_25095 [Mikania micrantha]|uniref:Uncharacterized protein n=1 Tax=Mikania micrantha TaxID=192012 RepID=A0A5N6N485_9ASTR|nr:hypothetical protein E3N88_25095 [Mikania micrantha]